jgi:hypothetical protein
VKSPTLLKLCTQHTLVPEHYKPYMPNWNAIGLGFVVHQTFYSLAMYVPFATQRCCTVNGRDRVVGAVANQYWERHSPITHEMYMFAISVSVAIPSLGVTLMTGLSARRVS